MTDLRMKRGDTLRLTAGPLVVDGVPQDLTGSTIRFTAKDRLSDDDASAVLTGVNPGQITIPSQAGSLRGYAYVAIPASQTAGFTAKRVLHWDVQASQPDGTTITLDDGLLYVELDVTRST